MLRYLESWPKAVRYGPLAVLYWGGGRWKVLFPKEAKLNVLSLSLSPLRTVQVCGGVHTPEFYCFNHKTVWLWFSELEP